MWNINSAYENTLAASFFKTLSDSFTRKINLTLNIHPNVLEKNIDVMIATKIKKNSKKIESDFVLMEVLWYNPHQDEWRNNSI